LVRRRALRNNDFIDLIVNKQLVESKTKFYELIKNNSTIPLDLRIKGLKEKLSNSELCVALFNYLQHRGFFYDIPDEQVNDDNEQEKTKLDKSIEEIVNNSIKSGKKPSEIQKEFYSKDGYYVGHPCNLCFSNKC
jgi:CRISPR-associated endonuclease Csn1